MPYPHGVSTTRRSAGQMDSHQRKSSPAESSRPAPPPTLVRAQQHELEENLRALPRRALQALAKRFKIKANAKSVDIIKQLVRAQQHGLEEILRALRRRDLQALAKCFKVKATLTSELTSLSSS